jgi:hypothetical protein
MNKSNQVAIAGQDFPELEAEVAKAREKALMRTQSIKEVQTLFYFCEFLNLQDLLRVSQVSR